MGEEDGADFVEFVEGEGVQWVVGYVGGVEAGGGFGWLFDIGLKETVLEVHHRELVEQSSNSSALLVSGRVYGRLVKVNRRRRATITVRKRNRMRFLVSMLVSHRK